MKLTLPYSLSDEEIVSAYKSTGSVWKAAALVGLSGQTVHKRLARIGAVTQMRYLAESEKEQVRKLYSAGFKKGDGVLDALSLALGRTKNFICRFAKSEGLSNRARTYSDQAKSKASVITKRRWINQPHPRGATGMKHSAATKMMMSWRSRSAWGAMSEEQRAAMTRKMMETRVRNGTVIPLRKNVTWKQGWREIVGRRIYFRSRWEFNYAVYLQFLVEQKQIAAWEHEPETFWFDGVKRGCVSYLPDYRVTNNDGSIEYHEVKGWMDSRSKTKLRRMKKYHPDVKMRVIDSRWFKANGPKLSFLASWER